MSDPLPIYAVTQFTGTTGAFWAGLTTPVPAGILTVESDTGIIKRGDGVTMYANLPVFFNALYLQNVETTATQTAASAAAAAISAAAAQQSAILASSFSTQSQVGNRIYANTTEATPTEFTGIPELLPTSIMNNTITGRVTAQNATTGDVAIWDISAVAIRRSVGGSVSLPITPYVAPYYADPAMQACGLTITTDGAELILTAIGLIATTIAWAGNLLIAGTPNPS